MNTSLKRNSNTKPKSNVYCKYFFSPLLLFHLFFALEIAIVLVVGIFWKIHLEINKCL